MTTSSTQVISLATGMLVYNDLAFAFVFAVALKLCPCLRNGLAEVKFWDCLKMIFAE